MSNLQFDFKTQHVCRASIEANVFIHGYSAGHNESDRQALLCSIPEDFCQHTNIFAFWPSNHYAYFGHASLLKIGTAAAAQSPLWGVQGFTFLSSVATDRVGNFTEARKRAEHMGGLLFIQLNEYLAKHYPQINTLNLIGHSLGGRLVVSSLKTLADRLHPRLTVNDILLMAAAVEVKPDEARHMRSLIRGRLINAYSKDDQVLLMPVDETCLGRHEVEHFDNVLIDGFGHSDYWKKLPEVFSRSAFKKALQPAAPAHTPSAAATTQSLPVESPNPMQAITLELKNPSVIYQRINSELAQIVAALDSPSKDATLNQAQNDARELLTQYQTKLVIQLAELEKNAEWNTFTIAFYGETNAGKSTLIETLRILLQESSKVKVRQEFHGLRERYTSNENDLRKVRSRLSEIDDFLCNELPRKKLDACDLHDRSNNVVLGKIVTIQDAIIQRDMSASFWIKLIAFLGRMLGIIKRDPYRLELESAKQESARILTAHELAMAILEDERTKANHAKIELEDSVSDIQDRMGKYASEMQNLADGGIIGDGRPDFTRQTQHYDFELDGQPFTLLDVPGIEGKEDSVLLQIEQAVQTAHAVFYVANKAAPPQTGTLEKIKEHLGAQTEVWTLFNKKISNPKHQLMGRPLISDDEKVSLDGLNEKMCEQLGKNYRDVFPLTAMSAFLASTDHFAPGSQNALRRSKMLEDFGADDLLEKSHINAFLHLLRDLIRDSKAKITRANFNKAKESLDQTHTMLAGVQQNFAELAEKLEQSGESAKLQLSSSFKALKQRLDSRGETLISNFASTIRKNMYARIDNDIGNDIFKDALHSQFESQQENLSKQFSVIVGSEIVKFQKDAEEILKEFEAHAKELTSTYEQLNGTSFSEAFSIKIKIDNGINVTGLLAGLIGLALAPFTGGASLWVAGGAIVTGVVSVGKAVWSAFSSDYKKSQQRAAVEKSLRDVAGRLRESLRSSLEKTFPEMQRTISQLEQVLDAPSRHATAVVQSLTRSNDQLKVLSRKVDYTGAL